MENKEILEELKKIKKSIGIIFQIYREVIIIKENINSNSQICYKCEESL